MKAVIIKKYGDLGGSILKTGIEIPRPSQHEVLIKVKAAGVNRPDILQRQGLYKVPSDASPIMGLEVACLLYTSPSPRDISGSRMPSSA